MITKGKYKLLSIVVAVVLMAVTMMGCNPDEGSGVTDEGDKLGTHIYKITDSGLAPIVSTGKTDYKILIPESAGTYVAFAAEELSYFLYESTGVQLEIINDSAYDANGKYFSIGNTKILKKNNLAPSIDLVSDEGFVIKSQGSNICIAGATEKGTMYGVYGYLESTLDFDFFYKDTYHINRVTELPHKNYDVTDVPDVTVRAYGHALMGASLETERRSRTTFRSDFLMPKDGQPSHTSLSYVSPTKYSSHPKWFSSSKTQLCYTAQGDKEEYTALIDATAQEIYDTFELDTAKKFYALSFSAMDNYDWCTCQECSDVINHYGAKSATMILFNNDLAVALEKKLAESENEHLKSLSDRFIIASLFYHATVDVPVKTSVVDGKTVFEFEPEMVMNKHVAPLYAPIGSDWGQSFYESSYYSTLTKLSAISETLFFWTYDTNFAHYLIPFFTFDALDDIYKICAENNVYYHYNQGQYNNANSTGFAVLKSYINAKLGWNCNLTVQELIDRFFKGVYGSQSDEMKEIFDEFRAWDSYQKTELGYNGERVVNGVMAKLWTYSFLTDKIERMYDCLDKLTASGENKAAAAVRLELISPLYLIIECYDTALNNTVKAKYYRDVRTYITECGISAQSEPNSISAWLDTLV